MRILFLLFLLMAGLSRPALAELPKICEEGKYVSAMHPNFRGDKGDNCPVCGMEMVPDPVCFPEEAKQEQTKERKILYWHDPMVPGTKFDKPGKSPFMDMDLVPVYEDEISGAPEGAINIKPKYQQALGVKTSPVSKKQFGHSIRSFGEIVPSTRNELMFHMRSEGWIVDLATDAVGDTVKKGDLLFTYYSPDLMNAQSDFLIGNRVGNAEERLRLFGMDDKAIAELKEKGRMMRETPFYAPMDGTIIDLKVRKGSFVKEGDLALSMQDFSQVWVNTDVPLQDLQFLEIGQSAKIMVPETGKTYDSTIDFIHHVADPQTRTGTVRLVLPHKHLEPKPGTYVDVVFDADTQDRLAVPAEAVLYDGTGAKIIESLGDGYFRPVSVQTGITVGGLTEIISGLEEGQEIVTSGQFMIDAESSLRGGMANMGNMETEEAMDMNDMKKEHNHEHE